MIPWRPWWQAIRDWWLRVRYPPQCQTVDFSTMSDRAVVHFYAANFPGRFTKDEIERGVGHSIDWSAVDHGDLRQLRHAQGCE